jgi:biotin operon repressor
VSDFAWADLVLLRLPLGRDRAVTLSELAETLGVSRRVVERAIESLRARGEAVCTGADGAWLSRDSAELLAQVEALRRRAIHQLVNVRALRATARRYQRTQQMEMFG